MAEILYRELSYQIIGAAMEVHRVLGPGFLEAVYQAALAHEMTLRQIPFEQLVPLPVTYKGVNVGSYEADFWVNESLILELKAVAAFSPGHEAQAINYLTATMTPLAILINFGTPSLEHKRILNKKLLQEKR
jgi:GxxExxY protein